MSLVSTPTGTCLSLLATTSEDWIHIAPPETKHVYQEVQLLTVSRIIVFMFAFCTILLGACGSAEPTEFVPAGLVQGKPTFVYLFTEN